jgi:hypothetical protein
MSWNNLAVRVSSLSADRVQLIDAEYAGMWELPVLGAVIAPAAVLIQPDGYVAWVGDLTHRGLPDALATCDAAARRGQPRKAASDRVNRGIVQPGKVPGTGLHRQLGILEETGIPGGVLRGSPTSYSPASSVSADKTIPCCRLTLMGGEHNHAARAAGHTVSGGYLESSRLCRA